MEFECRYKDRTVMIRATSVGRAREKVAGMLMAERRASPFFGIREALLEAEKWTVVGRA